MRSCDAAPVPCASSVSCRLVCALLGVCVCLQTGNAACGALLAGAHLLTVSAEDPSPHSYSIMTVVAALLDGTRGTLCFVWVAMSVLRVCDFSRRVQLQEEPV